MKFTFDKSANLYDKELQSSLGFFGKGSTEIFAEYKIKILKNELLTDPVKILEFGCGTGRNCFFLEKYFNTSKIFGCDISEESIIIARQNTETVMYSKICKPSDLIDIYKEPFDLVFISNVLHHIPFDEQQMWLKSIYEITSLGGTLVVFEHNPYNPVTNFIFKNSSIDKGALMLKASNCMELIEKTKFKIHSKKYTLFFLIRNNITIFIEKILYRVPLGAQYYIVGKKVNV